ncbi:MAG TPA: hypothetical protein PKA64_17985, partial [Myxococcota bacterium]|nr:hypothetical protein [Myxococcota bacterium]
LRDRGDDAVLLARAWLREHRPGTEMTAAACQRLRAWPWGGNVPELHAALANAVADAPGDLDARHLDALRPPSVPTIVTTSTGALDPALHPATLHRAGAASLHVPPIRDRDPAAVRALILGIAEGHPIRPEALAALAAMPWWGELPELQAALAALRRDWHRPIDMEHLHRVLPHGPPDLRPIEIMLAPVSLGDHIDGVRATLHARAVAIGRLTTPRRLPAAVSGPRERRQWLDRVLRGPAACFPLPMVPDASLLQAIITRDPQGLVVHAPAWARLVVHAGPLGGPGVLSVVRQDHPIAIGLGGEIQLVTSGGEPRLQLFVFAGATAMDELGPNALARAITDPIETIDLMPVEAGVQRWVLDPIEARALVNLLATLPGGELDGWIAHTLTLMRRRPELAALTAFLRTSPSPAEDVGRLMEYDGNEHIGPALLARIRELGDVEPRLARLPARIRRLTAP